MGGPIHWLRSSCYSTTTEDKVVTAFPFEKVSRDVRAQEGFHLRWEWQFPDQGLEMLAAHCLAYRVVC